ncbi:MAG: hypothetical protein ACREHV_14115 [Rhizomicrobium sp.]
MRHALHAGFGTRNSTGEGLLFSAAFVSVVVAIASALYAMDVAMVRALLSFP